jgi:hypothetical protein
VLALHTPSLHWSSSAHCLATDRRRLLSPELYYSDVTPLPSTMSVNVTMPRVPARTWTSEGILRAKRRDHSGISIPSN